MTHHRYRDQPGSFDRYWFPDNKKALVFVHGLGGCATSEYWGQLIELGAYDRRLANYDLYFFRYESTKWLTGRGLWPSSTGETISPVSEVMALLAGDLASIQLEKRYEVISLIGHSLGGLVSLGACTYSVKNKLKLPVRSVCLLGTPLVALVLARVGYALSLGTNPHLKFLCQKRIILETLNDGMKAVKKLKGIVIYMHCIGDRLLRLHHIYRKRRFSAVVALRGPHNPLTAITTRQSPNYEKLVEHIIENGEEAAIDRKSGGAP
jgi:pimeloyl-ACP methyl ester carboxylesterase